MKIVIDRVLDIKSRRDDECTRRVEIQRCDNLKSSGWVDISCWPTDTCP